MNTYYILYLAVGPSFSPPTAIGRDEDLCVLRMRLSITGMSSFDVAQPLGFRFARCLDDGTALCQGWVSHFRNPRDTQDRDLGSDGLALFLATDWGVGTGPLGK